MWSGSISLFLASLTAFCTANWFNAKGQKTLQEMTPKTRHKESLEDLRNKTANCGARLTSLLISEAMKTAIIIKQE